MDWDQVASKVSPYIVKIETPTGSGTGFLCLYNDSKNLCGVATALHVVEHADEWQQPIRINHHQSGKTAFLKESDRFLFMNWITDSSIILFSKSIADLPFPESTIRLLPLDKFIDHFFHV